MKDFLKNFSKLSLTNPEKNLMLKWAKRGGGYLE
jgi:hypothetical protein